jgi:hypothetical protein
MILEMLRELISKIAKSARRPKRTLDPERWRYYEYLK